MLIVVILAASTIAQLITAVIAIRLIRETGRSPAWIMISVAFIFMALRRIVPLFVTVSSVNAQHVNLMLELLGLTLSVLMLGGVVHIRMMFVEHHLLLRQLRLTSEKLSGIIEFLPDATFVIDTSRRVIAWNRAVECMTGVRKEDILGRDAYSLCFYNERRPILIDIALEPDQIVNVRYPEIDIQPGAVQGESFVPKAWSGKGAMCWGAASKLFDTDGNLIGAIETVRDITERKRTETELAELNARLEERVLQAVDENRKKDQILLIQSRQAAMGEMLCNIAHQWRQPLNAMGLIIQNIQEYYERGVLDRKYLTESVGTGLKLLVHMSKTIDDFRNYFKPDKTRVGFCVNDSVEQALSLVESSFENNRIRVEKDYRDRICYFGYPNEFSQVIINILNNAMEAFQENGGPEEKRLVKICVAKMEGKGIVTLTDNAGGIPAAVLPKIFEPYFSTKMTGTGVGLYMAKSIIERNMGGQLQVRNVLHGVEFRIELPVDSCEKSDRSTEPDAPSAKTRGFIPDK